MPRGPLVRVDPSRWDFEARKLWTVDRLENYVYDRSLYDETLLSCMCPAAALSSNKLGEGTGITEIADYEVINDTGNIGTRVDQCDQAAVLWNRIGSSSKDAEVYRTTVVYDTPMHHVLQTAVKVLAIVDAESDEKNNNEIRIAKMASSLVEQGISPYFLLVYGSRSCENMWFGSVSSMGRSAHRWAIRKYLEASVPSSQQRIAEKIVSQYEDRLVEVTRNFVSRRWVEPWLLVLVENIEMGGKTVTGLEVDENITLPGYVLVSELAYGDLGALAVRINLSEEQWFSLIADVLYAIRDLQEHLSVVHNDLHVGNVLLAVTQEGQASSGSQYEVLQPVIHDFGRSFVVSNWRPELRIRDVHEFVSKVVLSLGSVLPESVTLAIDELDSQLTDLSFLGEDTMNAVINRWQDLVNLDTEGVVGTPYQEE